MIMEVSNTTRFACIFAFALGLAACGGGDSDPDNPGGSNPAITEWQAGVYPAQNQLAARCANPRSGNDPYNNNEPYPDMQGSAAYEKMWLRSWTNDWYLWYDEVPDINHVGYSVEDYFDILRTNELTNSGAYKDNFHFFTDTESWNELSQSGNIGAGYGMQLLIDNGTPREVVVAFVEPNSPASEVGIERGTRILEVDGVDVSSDTQSGINTLNAGLFPENTGEAHDIVFQRIGDTPELATLISASITTTPVQHVQTFENADTKVGYLLFNDHIATAETGLKNAFEQLATEEVDELILDLRYNGGGYTAIAAQVAYMIAGSEASGNATFQSQQFNDKIQDFNPITEQYIQPLPFLDITVGFSEEYGQDLPSLNLERVFVISSYNTCSASEAIINGLRGIGIEVILIGDQTCGKPYGFYAADNCGTTYFTIQYQSVNALGYGEYADGFIPAATDNGEDLVRGCTAIDDLDNGFNENEDSIATALTYIENGSCSGASFNKTLSPQLSKPSPSRSYTMLDIPPWRKAAIMNYRAGQ